MSTWMTSMQRSPTRREGRKPGNCKAPGFATARLQEGLDQAIK